MKYYLVFLDRFRTAIISAESSEQLEAMIKMATSDWPHISQGTEVKIWNHVPYKRELE